MLAEQSLLGALLISPERVLPIVCGKVSENDFQIEADRAIYNAARELFDNGETVDPVCILRKTAENGFSVENKYLFELINLTPTAANAEIYCREFLIESSRQKLVEISQTAAKRLNDKESVHQVSAWLRDAAAEAAERSASGGIVTSTSAMLDFREHRSNLENGKKSAVVSTGYLEIDEILGGGFANEGMYILAARPGSGKTTLALNLAERVATGKSAVLFVSLEMSLTQLTAKRLAIKTGLSSTWLLNNPDSSLERWQSINSASAELAEKPLVFNRAKSVGVDDIEKLASQTDGLKLIIVDYLGLIRHNEGKSLYEKVTATSGALKRLARTLSVPVLCLAQLNREVEGRSSGEPKMSDLRDSGAIEQDADGILLLHRYRVELSDKTAPAPLKVIIAKNRHGETGYIDLDFYLANGRIH